MVVIRYKQPETADAARPADPDILAGAVRRLLHQTDLGSCPGSGDRRRSGSWTAHRNRRAVGARTARQDGFRPLPWRAQPRPLVRAVDGPRPAALAGRGVRSGWPGGGWDRRDDRAALGAEDLGTRHLPRPGALLARPLCQGQRAALDQRHAAGPDPVGRADLGAAVPDGSRPLGTFRPAGRPAPQAAGRLGPAVAASGQPLA